MQIEKSISDKYLKTYMAEDQAGSADLIAFPRSTEEVAEFMQKANSQNQHVVTVGSQTGLTSATYPTNHAWLLSIEKMNQIISLDEQTLTLNVQAGVTLADIRDYLKGTPYFYAPDPGNKNASVGGTASTNAGGMRAIKYGVTRDNIRGYDVVLANGEIMHVGSLNKKDATAYDLKDLFIGAEGTLGVITEMQLKLTPRPLYEKSLILGFASLDGVANTIFEVVKSPVQPIALELLEESGIHYSEQFIDKEMPAVPGQAFLLATVADNGHAGLDYQLETIQELGNKAGAIEARELSENEASEMWQIRDNILNGIVAQGDWKMYDPVVPNHYFTNLVIEGKRLGEKHQVKTGFFGHAGDGNIHICVMRDTQSDQEWEATKKAYEHDLFTYVANHGGLLTAEHGIGLEKKDYLSYFKDETYISVLRGIKKALDPKGILNPGKMFD
ncbi:FAD-binding oxidoreductase [Aerococcus kribbianus]|uniref:FAD-binding oxidoreductase n=1 Tax=Aerococcus kribbianus TaxID=2999064 RepID=A0A9X3JD56_9LACT|nr:MULTISPECIES: FAD-binding oxidoreductase [unclassified Aerococcus]MCZ0717155.1 FAD-binding oxidoreductase [Aerococcus sp. YH-aer221]MCZ0725443.1 FAD-binding oxidoreductase [Aerococcus sp. YH-aer222]